MLSAEICNASHGNRFEKERIDILWNNDSYWHFKNFFLERTFLVEKKFRFRIIWFLTENLIVQIYFSLSFRYVFQNFLRIEHYLLWAVETRSLKWFLDSTEQKEAVRTKIRIIRWLLGVVLLAFSEKGAGNDSIVRQRIILLSCLSTNASFLTECCNWTSRNT